MPSLGLVRTPRRIAGLLSAAAAGAATAAAELSAVGRGLDRHEAVAEAVRDVRRLVHETSLETGEMLGGGLDRSDVLAIVLSIKDVADRIEEAAAALRHTEPRTTPWTALTGVTRDSARALAAAISRLDGPSRDRDASLERIEVLYAEGRRLIRGDRARMLGPGADPLAAVRAEETARRLERALRAAVRSGRTARRVAVKHA
ncbi:MAG: hypothetical protein ACRDPC_10790 [Solirubrobacteraceae bacterium]